MALPLAEAFTARSLGVMWDNYKKTLGTAPYLQKILGKRGLIALEQLMGMLLAVIGTGMLAMGVRMFIDFVGKKSGTSAILTNMLGNPALLIQNQDSLDIKSGDLVDIILLNNLK